MITKKINELKKLKKLTNQKLSELSGIPLGTLNKITSGITTDPKIETLKALAKAFDCTLDDFDVNNTEKKLLSNKETQLLSSFNKLNTLGQEKAIERVEELTQIEKYTINNVSEELCVTRTDIKNIQLYEIPASAGTGMLITDDVPYEIKQIDLTIAPQARKADFALYVRGDSMEPSYYDGDIIFIKSQPAVDNGQIGIFIYDDESYIKKYSVQEDGAYLVSLNKKYEPIKIDENLNFKVCGLVL